MDLRRIVLALGLALVLSGGVAYVLYGRLRGHPGTNPQVIKIVAAVKAVPAGSALKAEDVALLDWPQNIPIAGSFSKTDDVVGRDYYQPTTHGASPVVSVGVVMNAPGANAYCPRYRA